MRKRVTVFLSIFICVFAVIFVAAIAVYNSDWAKEKNEGSLWSSSSVFELNRENPESFCFFAVDEGDFIELEVDIKELNGSILVCVYTFDKSEEIDHDINDIELKDQIICDEIEKTGRYKYSLDSKNVSNYCINIELSDDSRDAVVQDIVYTWCNNWTNLMYKLGVKKGKKTDVNSIRTITE